MVKTGWGVLMPVITCNVCGKRQEYDKGMDPLKFVCYSCRNKHTIQNAQSETNKTGFYCMSENANGDKIQSCWTCKEPTATHFIKFEFIFKIHESSKPETREMWTYACDTCCKKYKRLDGKVFDATNEENILSYSDNVLLEYFLQKKEMK